MVTRRRPNARTRRAQWTAAGVARYRAGVARDRARSLERAGLPRGVDAEQFLTMFRDIAARIRDGLAPLAGLGAAFTRLGASIRARLDVLEAANRLRAARSWLLLLEELGGCQTCQGTGGSLVVGDSVYGYCDACAGTGYAAGIDLDLARRRVAILELDYVDALDRVAELERPQGSPHPGEDRPTIVLVDEPLLERE